MIRILLVLCLLGPGAASAAGWSFNIGSHNPPGSTLGVNFMHLWTNWAFEIGVGGVQGSKTTDSNGDETRSTTAYGALSLKYLFRSGVVRPYLMIGSGSAATVSSGEDTTAGADVGGTFFGGGIFLMGNPFYVYLGLSSAGKTGGSTNTMAGLGFDF